jgi:hypothetical protein
MPGRSLMAAVRKFREGMLQTHVAARGFGLDFGCNDQTHGDEDPMHLYWCADCKTEGCKRRQIFKDVEFAAQAGDEPTVQLNFSAKFEMRCKTCGIVHSYSRKDIEDFQSNDSLPLGFDSPS